MRMILLLRGVNVGGKNKVPMAELKEKLAQAGFSNVQSYINSGNLFFGSDISKEETEQSIAQVLQAYDFDIPFTLLSQDRYKKIIQNLPAWWADELARKDVLFITNSTKLDEIKQCIKSMKFHNELVHFSEEVIFWGKIDEKESLKTAYHKELIKQPFYKQITIRNGNTFDKIGEFLRWD